MTERDVSSLQKNIERNGEDFALIALLYMGLTLSSFLHNWAHFFLLRSTGAVSTGVLQALRSIGVFVVSSLLFCDQYATQCMTSLKTIACLLVSAGVLMVLTPQNSQSLTFY